MKSCQNQLVKINALQYVREIVNSTFKKNDPKKLFYLTLLENYDDHIENSKHNKLFDSFRKLLSKHKNNLSSREEILEAKDFLTLHLEDLTNLIKENDEYFPEYSANLSDLISDKFSNCEKKLLTYLEELATNLCPTKDVVETIYLDRIIKKINESDKIAEELKPLYSSLFSSELITEKHNQTIADIAYFYMTNPKAKHQFKFYKDTQYSQILSDILSPIREVLNDNLSGNNITDLEFFEYFVKKQEKIIVQNSLENTTRNCPNKIFWIDSSNNIKKIQSENFSKSLM